MDTRASEDDHGGIRGRANKNVGWLVRNLTIVDKTKMEDRAAEAVAINYQTNILKNTSSRPESPKAINRALMYCSKACLTSGSTLAAASKASAKLRSNRNAMADGCWNGRSGTH